MDNTRMEQTTIRKVSIRLIPYLFIGYMIAFLDRVSITYSSMGGMDKSLNISASMFGFISGIFFLGYILFEIPSNLLLKRFGARKWIGRILLTWGIVTMITAWADSVTHLYMLRFLLGIAEAGFFPGIILYITFWFRSKERAKVVALIMTAPPLANAFGAPISIWIVENIRWAGLPGWRWLFILAGIPAIVLGILTFFYLTDTPEKAKWLTYEQKEWLTHAIRQEENNKANEKGLSIKAVFRDRIVWRFALTNLTFVVGLYGISFWMPRIIKSLSDVFTNSQVGVITMLPYLCGAIAMVWMGIHSDRSGERKYHAAFGPLLGAIGLIGLLFSPNLFVSISMICLTTAGLYSFSGPYWAFTSATVSAQAAAVGIGIINSVGNFVGFVGPYVIGLLNDATGNITIGIAFLALMLVLTCTQILAVKKEENSCL